MRKINTPISLCYVVLLFRYGLSHLVMWSLWMIMCTFCLVESSYNLIVRLLYLVLCTSYLVILYFLVQCSFYLVMRSCYSVMCSFHYSLFFALFLSTFCIHSFYVLFVSALCIRLLNALFLWHLSRCITIEELKVSQLPQARLPNCKRRWWTAKNKHGNDHVSLETIFEILDKLGLNLVTKKFQDEKVDI